MIKAKFFSDSSKLYGFKISGHAGYAPSGEDIVCASVSAVATMTANAISEIHKTKADIKVADGNLELRLQDHRQESINLIEGLHLFLKELSLQYPKYLKVTTIERSYNHD